LYEKYYFSAFELLISGYRVSWWFDWFLRAWIWYWWYSH